MSYDNWLTAPYEAGAERDAEWEYALEMLADDGNENPTDAEVEEYIDHLHELAEDARAEAIIEDREMEADYY